ncbi:MAG: SHOCT domain-containing protein, partial [Acidimicrobiales bacterium]
QGAILMFAAYTLVDVFLSMLWFTLFVMWIWLFFSLIADVFRSADLSGWGKAGWTVFMIVTPFLGVFVYLIARGKHMSERQLADASQQEAAFRSYVQSVAATPTDDVTKLADLHDRGVIDDQEFQQLKTRAVS